MKSIRRGALALLALCATGLAVAALRIDAESVRAALGASLEAAFGEPVELGPAELALFPLPAARIRNVRIGRAPGPSLQAPELRAGVSLASLFLGQVVLRSLELDSPRVSLGAGPTPPRPEPSAWPSAAPRVGLAITRLVVRDGALEAGPLALARIELRGALGPSASARFEFSAESPGLARLFDGELELSALAGPVASWPWKARARLAELDLAELRRRLGLPGMWGSAEGTLAVSGRGAASEHVSLALASADLDFKGALLRATGRTALAAELPGRLELDFSGAAVAVAGLIEKPAGVPLRVSAQLAEPRSLRFTELRIASAALEASGELRLDGDADLQLSPATLELAALEGWKRPGWLPRRGRVLLERARIGGEPLALSAEGALADVDFPLGEKLSVRVSGPVRADGTELRGDELSVALAGEAISVSALYDWRDRRLALAANARGPRLGPVAEAVWGRRDVSGRLYGRLELAGPPDLFGLTGEGELELIDGELPGVSIARSAGLERSFGEPPGLDRFEKLGGRFVVAGDQVKVLELTLVQEFATATVSGDLGLRDLRADFTGAVRMAFPELPAPQLRPILRMEGPLTALETHISTADTDEVREIEARTIEAIRKAEREQRERKTGRDPG